MERALVTGVTGQDGIYLARLLAARGVEVMGTTRPDQPDDERRTAYLPMVRTVAVDLADAQGLRGVVADVAPDVVFNLGGLSSVSRSWSHPEETYAVNADAVQVLTEALLGVRDRTGRDVRLVQASTGEVGVGESPYARSKAAAEEAVRDARDRHGLHAGVARLHIHDSPLRSESFVSRRISRGVAEIALGRTDVLTLGNLDVVRDWGFAGDYVEALVRMAEHDEPLELPIGSGVRHGLDELVAAAFAAVGIDDPARHVRQDPALLRPADIPELVADPAPAETALGWRARVGLAEMVAHMVAVDLERLRTQVPEDVAYLTP